MKPHKQKRLLHCHLQQPFIQLFHFHVVDKHGMPLTRMCGPDKVYQVKIVTDNLQNYCSRPISLHVEAWGCRKRNTWYFKSLKDLNKNMREKI